MKENLTKNAYYVKAINVAGLAIVEAVSKLPQAQDEYDIYFLSLAFKKCGREGRITFNKVINLIQAKNGLDIYNLILTIKDFGIDIFNKVINLSEAKNGYNVYCLAGGLFNEIENS